MDLVDQFMLYTDGLQSSILYRKWCAITMIGGAMERRIKTVSTSRNNKNVNYANLYVMLIGPPTAGKGVINIVHNLWESTINGVKANAFYCAPHDVTKAALVDSLAAAKQTHIATNYKYHCLLFAAEEFSGTFAKFEGDFLSFLTIIWNAPSSFIELRRSREVKKIKIDEPLMTILAGYQPEMLNKILLKDAADQGFLRRCIVIWNERADLIPIFGDDSSDASFNNSLRGNILDRLSEISGLAGEMEWDQDAKTFFNKGHMSGWKPQPTHSRLTNYLGTRSQFILKLSMIASISESTDMRVQLHHVERARQWLLEAETTMPDAFDHIKGESDSHAIERYMAHLLKQQNEGITMTNAVLVTTTALHFITPKVKPILAHIMEMEFIVKRSDGTWRVTGKGFKPSVQA